MDMESLEGAIFHITFRNEENGFTVAKLREKDTHKEFTVVGLMIGVQVGESVRCEGYWKNDIKFGKQFDIRNIEVQIPATTQGIEQYLGSGLLSGIGPALAKRIVHRFGEDTLDIMAQNPDRLLEVDGVGKKKLKGIKASWNEQQGIRQVMIFLQRYQVSPVYAQKIFKAYGNQSIQKVQENPYRLAAEIIGIGFKKADAIAEQMGQVKEDPKRIQAGIEYTLEKLQEQGHTCYLLPNFLEKATSILLLPTELVENQIGHMIESKRIVVQSHTVDGEYLMFIGLRRMQLYEKEIVLEISRLLNHEMQKYTTIDKLKAQIEKATKLMGFELAVQQEEAVLKSLHHKMHIITGGPGTGKSTITKIILAILEKYTSKIALLAPTGRASKRLAEITGKQAFTIHSLLSFDFALGAFRRGKDNPIEADVIIVDEASMIDTYILKSLLCAVNHHTRLILVGDIDQLPSVGAGSVLRDLIQSGKIPTTRLTEIFRQATHSQIVMNAHKINQGIFPDVTIRKNADFFFLTEEQPENVQQLIAQLVESRLPKAYKLDATKDIQVLSPMHKGAIGTQELNALLQQRLNTPLKQNHIKRGQVVFAVGDKVMQLRNNYDKAVFNGDIGFVKIVNVAEKVLTVEIDDRWVDYQFSELHELELAYAVSIHKYQGSECPCVVIPVHTAHYRMLSRNLIYTGVTRGKRLVVLVGTHKALSIAIQNDKANQRYTGLSFLLNSEDTGFPEIKILPPLSN